MDYADYSLAFREILPLITHFCVIHAAIGVILMTAVFPFGEDAIRARLTRTVIAAAALVAFVATMSDAFKDIGYVQFPHIPSVVRALVMMGSLTFFTFVVPALFLLANCIRYAIEEAPGIMRRVSEWRRARTKTLPAPAR